MKVIDRLPRASSRPKRWPARACAEVAVPTAVRARAGRCTRRRWCSRCARRCSAGGARCARSARAPGAAKRARRSAALLAIARAGKRSSRRRARHRAAVRRRRRYLAAGQGAGERHADRVRFVDDGRAGRSGTAASCCTAPTAARPGSASSTASSGGARARAAAPTPRAGQRRERQALAEPSAWSPTAPTSRSSTCTSSTRSGLVVGAYGLAFATDDGGKRWRRCRTAFPTRRASTCTHPRVRQHMLHRGRAGPAVALDGWRRAFVA